MEEQGGRPSPVAVRSRRRRLGVALTFPLAFAVHDAEEVLAAAWWQRNGPERVRRLFPGVPEPVLEALAVSPLRMKVAVSVVAAGVAAVGASSVKGLDGPLRPLQAALAAYTAHSLTHLAQAAVLRSYTPGVLTSVAVIWPYSWWAWKTLRKAGVRAEPRAMPRLLGAGAAAALGLAAAGHAAGLFYERARRQRCSRHGPGTPEAFVLAGSGLRAHPGGRRAASGNRPGSGRVRT